MIDTNKHAREIGRHLRNHRYEATGSGILIDKGGMNMLANGAFKDTLYRGDSADSQISENVVCDQFLIHMLNVLFNGATQVTQWYIGLFSGNVTPNGGTWTGANVVANATEVTAYPGTDRPAFDVETTATTSLSNTGSEAMFEFNAPVPFVRGAFLVQAAAKGSTTGILCAATRFAADRAGLNSPDRLGVQYIITGADAGT